MGSDRRQAVLLDSFAGEMENVVRPLKAIFVQCHISSNIAGSYIYDLPVVHGVHAHLHRLMFLSGGVRSPIGANRKSVSTGHATNPASTAAIL